MAKLGPPGVVAWVMLLRAAPPIVGHEGEAAAQLKRRERGRAEDAARAGWPVDHVGVERRGGSLDVDADPLPRLEMAFVHVPRADGVPGEEGTPAFEAARPVRVHGVGARVKGRVEGAVRDGAGSAGALERGAVAGELAPNEKARRDRRTAARSAG